MISTSSRRVNCRHALFRPLLHGGAEGVVHCLLRQVEVVQQAALRLHAAEVERAIVTVAKEKWGEAKYGDVLKSLKASDKLAIHDGDSKSDYEGYAGHLFLNASNKIRPTVVGPDRAPLTAADGKPYSGAYVNCILELWAQDNTYGKRINASLLGVQFLRDGMRVRLPGERSQPGKST